MRRGSVNHQILLLGHPTDWEILEGEVPLGERDDDSVTEEQRKEFEASSIHGDWVPRQGIMEKIMAQNNMS